MPLRTRLTIAFASGLVATAVPVVAHAQAVCTAGSISAYASLAGGPGCTFGGLTFLFQYMQAYRNGIPGNPNPTITINPFLRTDATGKYVGFSVVTNPALITSSAGAIATNSRSTDGVNDYYDAANIILQGRFQVVGSTLVGAGVGGWAGAAAFATGDWNVGAAVQIIGNSTFGSAFRRYDTLGIPGATMYEECFGSSGQTCSDPELTKSAASLDVFDAYLLHGVTAEPVPAGTLPNGDASATVTSGEFVFQVSALPATAVPEPTSVALMGTGLLAIASAGAVRRRRRTS